MLSRFFELFKLVFNFYEDLQKLKETSKQHGQQLRVVAEQQIRLHYEYQIQREREPASANVKRMRTNAKWSNANAQCLSAKWNCSSAKIGCYVKS